MFVRLCALLSSPTLLHVLVLSVFGGVELGITVVLLREYLVVGRCDVLEGNRVKKGVLDGCFDSGVSIFELCVCVELGNQAAQSWEEVFCRLVLLREFLAQGLRDGDEDFN